MEILKCENASWRFQQGENPSRGILHDCENFADLQFQVYRRQCVLQLLMVSSSGSSSGSRRETAGNFWSPLRSHSSPELAGWEQEHNDHKRSTMSRKNNEGPALSGPVISSLQLHSPRYHQHWAGQVRGHGPLAPVYTQGREGWPLLSLQSFTTAASLLHPVHTN